jgi:hypothetical protein
MARSSKSPKSYLERKRLVRTLREPLPAHEKFGSRAHLLPLQTPLPLPEYKQVTLGDPQPDRGATGDWPHGRE